MIAVVGGLMQRPAIDVLLPLLLGPVMYNSQRDVPMDDEFAEEVIDRFLASEASRLAAAQRS